MSAPMKRAANAKAWALGHGQRNGFHVRRVVWGLTMAIAERRFGESIRAAVIMVGSPRKGEQPPKAPSKAIPTRRAAVTTEQAAMQHTTQET